MKQKRTIVVTPEFISFTGHGVFDPACLPCEPLVIGFGDMGEPAVTILAQDDIDRGAPDHMLAFAIDRAACLRMFGNLPGLSDSWYLPADIRALGRALVAVEGEGEVEAMLRVARSLELLCQLFEALAQKRMVEYRGHTTLSEQDIMRVATAHQLVSERWQDRLTVDEVARQSGLGKAKLTRGFRELYSCTVAEAVSERRLTSARTLLSFSDLPISSIGYRCGYLNSASFTRAFARRYGVTPTDMRRSEKARDRAASIDGGAP